MKKALLLTLVLICCASFAFAQGGSVNVFSNNTGTACNIVEVGFVQLYYFHKFAPGATAVEFKADLSGTVSWNWFGDQLTPGFLKLGNFAGDASPLSGCAISYGGCLSGDIYLGSAAYAVAGLTPPCTLIPILPHGTPSIPGATTPLMVDCFDNIIAANGGAAIVNPNPTCDCDVPNEESSWGQIKALYE